MTVFYPLIEKKTCDCIRCYIKEFYDMYKEINRLHFNISRIFLFQFRTIQYQFTGKFESNQKTVDRRKKSKNQF